MIFRALNIVNIGKHNDTSILCNCNKYNVQHHHITHMMCSRILKSNRMHILYGLLTKTISYGNIKCCPNKGRTMS
jgi:hypothetical protein